MPNLTLRKRPRLWSTGQWWGNKIEYRVSPPQQRGAGQADWDPEEQKVHFHFKTIPNFSGEHSTVCLGADSNRTFVIHSYAQQTMTVSSAQRLWNVPSMEHMKLSGEVVTNHSALSQEAEGSWHWKGTMMVCGSSTCFSKLILKATALTIGIRQAADIFAMHIYAYQGC